MTVLFVLFVAGMLLWIMRLLELPPFFHHRHLPPIPSSKQLIDEWDTSSMYEESVRVYAPYEGIYLVDGHEIQAKQGDRLL